MRTTIKFICFLLALMPLSSHALVKFKLDAKLNAMPVMVIVSTSVNGLHNGGTSESRKPVLVSSSETQSIQPPLATPMLFSTVWVRFFHPDYLPVDVAVPRYAAIAGVVDMGTIHLRPLDDLLHHACDGLPAREVYPDMPDISSWLSPSSYALSFQTYIGHMDEQDMAADYAPPLQRLVNVLERARAARASCPPAAPTVPKPLYPPFTVDGWDPEQDKNLHQLVSVASLTRKQREQYYSFFDTYVSASRPRRDVVASRLREQPFVSELNERLGTIENGYDRSRRGKTFRWNNGNGDLYYEVKVGDYFISNKRTCLFVNFTLALSDPELARLQNSRAFYRNGKFCYFPDSKVWRPM